MSTKTPSNQASVNKAHQRFDKSYKYKRLWMYLALVPAIQAFVWNMAMFALFLALVGVFLTVRYYLKRQHLADRPLSTVQAASHGFVELEGCLKGEAVTSPMTKQACAFWRLRFIANDRKGDNAARVLIATVFSRPYVEFADKTGSCWLRAEDVDWHSNTRLEGFDEVASMMSKYESLLGQGFVDRWHEQSRLRIIHHASNWEVIETVVSQDEPLFASGLMQKRRSDEAGFDSPGSGVVDSSSDNVKWANEPMVHVHQSDNDQTPEYLNRAWVGVLKQIEGGDPSQPLSGSREVRILTQGADGKSVLEVHSGSKSSELGSLKIKMYLSFGLLVVSLGGLAVIGPQQLPIAIEQVREFFAH